MAGVKGRSGRKPTPSSVLKLRGTFREDRHHDHEPTPPKQIPEAPKCLKGEALAEWDRITALLSEIDCICLLDRAALTAYCIEWARYMNANNKLRVMKTLLADGSAGNKIPHPLLRVSDRAFANMLRICGEFGLTPASRTRIDVEAAAGVEDPLDKLMREQAERRKLGTNAG